MTTEISEPSRRAALHNLRTAPYDGASNYWSVTTIINTSHIIFIITIIIITIIIVIIIIFIVVVVLGLFFRENFYSIKYHQHRTLKP